jgi:hypothetical protein
MNLVITWLVHQLYAISSYIDWYKQLLYHASLLWSLEQRQPHKLHRYISSQAQPLESQIRKLQQKVTVQVDMREVATLYIWWGSYTLYMETNWRI